MTTTLISPEQASSAAPAPTKRKKRRDGTSLVLLLPALIMLVVFIGWPLLQLIIMSFQKYGREQIFGAPPSFVGFDNYVKVLTDPEFWVVLGRSVALCVVCVFATMVLGVGIALMMRALGKVMRTVVSVGLLLAWAMPALTATNAVAVSDARQNRVGAAIFLTMASPEYLAQR